MPCVRWLASDPKVDWRLLVSAIRKDFVELKREAAVEAIFDAVAEGDFGRLDDFCCEHGLADQYFEPEEAPVSLEALWKLWFMSENDYSFSVEEDTRFAIEAGKLMMAAPESGIFSDVCLRRPAEKVNRKPRKQGRKK